MRPWQRHGGLRRGGRQVGACCRPSRFACRRHARRALAVLFAFSLVFAPVFLAIPAFATAPALITVGYLLLSSVADIDFQDPSEAIPAFLTITFMPFAYSVSDGIMVGVISYTCINLICGKAKKVHWIMYVLTVIFVAKYALL